MYSIVLICNKEKTDKIISDYFSMTLFGLIAHVSYSDKNQKNIN